MQPAFHREQVASYAGAMVSEACGRRISGEPVSNSTSARR